MEVVSRDSLRGLEGQIYMMTRGYSRGFTQRPKGPDMYDNWMVFQGIHSGPRGSDIYDDWMVFQGIHLGPRGPNHSRISWVPITMKENA